MRPGPTDPANDLFGHRSAASPHSLPSELRPVGNSPRRPLNLPRAPVWENDSQVIARAWSPLGATLCELIRTARKSSYSALPPRTPTALA
jgi:hypothetical protein